jgi:hypothetical protein
VLQFFFRPARPGVTVGELSGCMTHNVLDQRIMHANTTSTDDICENCTENLRHPTEPVIILKMSL